jgi:hypothetical protein
MHRLSRRVIFQLYSAWPSIAGGTARAAGPLLILAALLSAPSGAHAANATEPSTIRVAQDQPPDSAPEEKPTPEEKPAPGEKPASKKAPAAKRAVKHPLAGPSVDKPNGPTTPPAQAGKSPSGQGAQAVPAAAAPGPSAAPTPPTPPSSAAAAPGPSPPPAPPTPPSAPAAEPQPVAHAAQAGIKACLDGLVRSANATIDTTHSAASQWYAGAADSHVFESIVSFTYPNRVAPRAIAVLFGAPTAAHDCDTSYVQVFPTARACNEIEGDLLKQGKVVANLSGLPVTVDAAGARQLLLPTPGNGCVVVGVGLTYGR